MNRMSMFLLGASLAFGLCVSAYLVSGAIRAMRQDVGIRVKGYAEQDVRSDRVEWDIAVHDRHADAATAYRKVEADIATVVARLKAIGFTDRELRINAANVVEEHASDEKGNSTNTIEFHRVSQAISIASDKVDLVLESERAVTDLIKGGIAVRSLTPSFTFSTLESLKLDLLGKASTNAYSRATTIVGGANGRIGTIRNASQGVFQIVPRNSTTVSDSGTYDTSTIDKTIKAVITVEYDVVK